MHHHHAIHLGAAWEPPPSADDATTAGGRTEWRRRFGRPAGLGAGDRVLLVVTHAGVAADLVLNTVPLPPLSADANRWEVDITALIGDRNELLVAAAVTLPPDAGCDAHGRSPLPSAYGRVTLEIVSAARPA
jgi:hypothetical protein